jgi:tRNA (cmo5U34)-methyltransferase
LADYYAQIDSHIYDLGCSTGAGLFAVNQSALANKAKMIGIDNSSAMISTAKEKLDLLSPIAEHELVCADLLDMQFDRASFVMMNYTLQFIDPAKRENLLATLYEAMLPNSALILSEKTQFESSEADYEVIELHHRFKASQGYSELEIAQKRDAIENVLIPESAQAHIARLEKVGFDIVVPWLQHFQFISFLAVKK